MSINCLILVCLSPTGSSSQESEKPQRKTNKFASQNQRFVRLGSFKDKKINESSGVVVATSEDGPVSAIWTFNDSGGEPRLYRVSLDGYTEARLTINGAKNRDWEAMCDFSIDEQRFLAIGDVGDNLEKRKRCTVYVVPEPKIGRMTDKKGRVLEQKFFATPQSFDFSYEDGPRNCEAMAYNMADSSYWFAGKIYANDKRKAAPGIYALSDPLLVSPQSVDEPPKNVAKRVCDFPVRNVTGMAFSPDGEKLAIRTYLGYYLFHKQADKSWQETMAAAKPVSQALPLQTQGEAVCFFSEGNSLLVTSELANAIIWKVMLDDPVPEPSAEPSAESKTENSKSKTKNDS